MHRHLRDGSLIEVLPQARAQAYAIYAMYPRSSRASRKVLALCDLDQSRLDKIGDEFGITRRILNFDDLPPVELYLIDHAGGCRDQVLIKLALEPLLHDFHVQQTQETTAKAKAQGLRHLGLVAQRRIVEPQFEAQDFKLV